jgi:hypothetical protein
MSFSNRIKWLGKHMAWKPGMEFDLAEEEIIYLECPCRVEHKVLPGQYYHIAPDKIIYIIRYLANYSNNDWVGI